MAKKHTNLEQHGDVWFYRMAIGGPGSVRSIRLSLKTTDVNVAAERAGIMRLRMERLRAALGGREDGLSPDEKASIARAAARQMRDHLDVPQVAAEIENPGEGMLAHLRGLQALDCVVTDLATQGMGPAWGSHDHFMARFVDGQPYLEGDTLEMIQAILDSSHGLAGRLDALGTVALRQRNLPITQINLELAKKAILLGKLGMIRTRIEELRAPGDEIERMLAELGLQVGGIPSDPVGPSREEKPSVVSVAHQAPAAPPAQPIDRFAEMTIRQAANAYLEAHPACDVGQKGSKWSEKTRSQFETLFFVLADKHFGAAPLASLDDASLAGFFRTLASLPTMHHRSDRHTGMSLDEIIAEGAGGPTLAVVTLNRHFRFFRAVLDWAFGRMASPPKIDWKAFIQHERGGRSARDQREAFTVDELRTFFAGPVWRGCKSNIRRFEAGGMVFHDAGFFVPMGLVYTGMRRGEWCGLPLADIAEIDGISVARLTPQRRLKNAGAIRDVPIADELIRLGFLDYVALQRRRGERWLFPDLVDSADDDGGERYQKRFWRSHQRAGQVPSGRTIHSMRHTVATELSEAGVSPKVVADLLGHTLQGETQGRYTKRASLGRLRDAVNALPRFTADVPARPIRLR